MINITLISGSTFGKTEELAENLSKILKNNNFKVKIFHGPNFLELPKNGLWLIVTSTYGSGDLPENLQEFFNYIKKKQPCLKNITFGAIGVGNREYDTFCGSIKKINYILLKCGAKRIGKILKIDSFRNKSLINSSKSWINKWIKKINS